MHDPAGQRRPRATGIHAGPPRRGHAGRALFRRTRHRRDAGDTEIERWFIAATLFGTRISAAVAERTFRVLSDAGLARIGQARHIPQDDFIALLDEGGYARYDERTATRLRALSDMISERYDGRAAVIGRRFTTYPTLRAALDVLPGWGPVTIQLFLRELRGVWPGAQPPLDQRATSGRAPPWPPRPRPGSARSAPPRPAGRRMSPRPPRPRKRAGQARPGPPPPRDARMPWTATLRPARVAEPRASTAAIPAPGRVRPAGQARQVTCEDLTAYLGMSGYAHYAGRAGMLLQSLCDVVGERYHGRAAAIGQRFTAYPALRASLQGLPGWGPGTIQQFLCELRGV